MLYCIVTGSCRPFKPSAQIQYTYELDGDIDGELFVAVVFQQYSHVVRMCMMNVRYLRNYIFTWSSLSKLFL